MKIIAEIGINHNGDLDTALDLLVMASKVGCNYVKFQKRAIDTVYTKEFLDSPRKSPWGETQGDQKRALELDIDAYRMINNYAQVSGIDWFASAWDIESFDFLEQFHPPLNKVASPMLTHSDFLRRVASTGRLTLISTGMSDYAQIIRAVDIFERASCPIVLMHCTSQYPCPDERVNLAVLRELKKKFPEHQVGYSNHSPGILASIGAAFLGAEWIEVHVTLDRSFYGSDQAASIEEPGLRRIVEYCRLAKTLIGDGIKTVSPIEKANALKLRYWEKSD